MHAVLEEERRQEKLRKLRKPKKQGWFKPGTEALDSVSVSSKGSGSESSGRGRLPTGPGRRKTAGISASSNRPRSRSQGRARRPTESMPLDVEVGVSTTSRPAFQSSRSQKILTVNKARPTYTRTNSAPSIMIEDCEPIVLTGTGGVPSREVTIDSTRGRLPTDETSAPSSYATSKSLHSSHGDNQIVDALICGMDDDRMADITLVGRDGAKVRATKFILACRSPVLQEKLYQDPTQVEVFIGDYGEDAIRAMKEYCHTGAIKGSVLMTKNNEEAARGLVELATLAKVYGFEPLYREADALLPQLINYSPWLATACFDSAGSETELMEEFLLQFIKGRCPDLLLETSSLKYMSQQRLLVLLEGIACSEDEMIKYLDKSRLQRR